MSIDVACDHCGARLRAPDSASGRKAKCPRCGRQIEIAGRAAPAGPRQPPAKPRVRRLAARPGTAQRLGLVATTDAGFFFSDDENLAVLEFLLANRLDGIGLIRGLIEQTRFTRSAGGVGYGWIGWVVGALMGTFLYVFTWPLYVGRHCASKLRVRQCARRLRTTPGNTYPSVRLGMPRRPVSFLVLLTPLAFWAFWSIRRRVGEIRRDMELHTGQTFGGRWRPFGGVSEAAAACRRHFLADSGTRVADPDLGVDRILSRVIDAVDTVGGGYRTMWRQYEEDLVERREKFPLLDPWRKVNAVQNALNRHWEFHMRVMVPEA